MNYGYSDDMVKKGTQFTQAEIDKILDAYKNENLNDAYYNFSNGSGHDISLSNINESQQYVNYSL